MDSAQRPRLTPVVRPVEQPDPLLLQPPLPSPPRALPMLVCTGRSWALGVPRTPASWSLKPLLWCEDRARGGVQGTSCPEGSSALAPSSWAPSFHRQASLFRSLGRADLGRRALWAGAWSLRGTTSHLAGQTPAGFFWGHWGLLPRPPQVLCGQRESSGLGADSQPNRATRCK